MVSPERQLMNLLREFFLTRTTGGYMSVNGECFHNKGRSITEIRSVLPESISGHELIPSKGTTLNNVSPH